MKQLPHTKSDRLCFEINDCKKNNRVRRLIEDQISPLDQFRPFRRSKTPFTYSAVSRLEAQTPDILISQTHERVPLIDR